MEIEREIQELVRKGSFRDADNDREVFVNSVCNTIQGVAGTSVAKIDRLIDELTQLRDHLQNESNRVESEIARVQSEIDGYTVKSEVAVQSLNAIDQSLGQFKRAVSKAY